MKFLNFFRTGEVTDVLQTSNALLMISTVLLNAGQYTASFDPLMSSFFNTMAVSSAALAVPNFLANITRGNLREILYADSAGYNVTASILLGLSTIAGVFKEKLLPGATITEQLVPFQALAATGLFSAMVGKVIDDYDQFILE